MSSSLTNGKIITFYSWKGGTGRTMALANVGVQLARAGRSTLLVDFDLEAPGLDRYFRINDDSNSFGMSVANPNDSSGLLGLINEGKASGSVELAPEAWQKRLNRITVPTGAATSWNKFVSTPSKLDLLASGHTHPDYSQTLSEFSWDEFYSSKHGAGWLESLRNEWRKAYDFVLIDSRTGLTDTGGVCTVHFPDTLVLVFTPNNQSFEGAMSIANSAQVARAEYEFERSPLTLIPLVSRWEGDKEVDLAELWMKRFDNELKPWTESWLPRAFSPRQFIEKMRVPHVARFSFGEPLPVLSHSLTDAALPGKAYDSLARLLAVGIVEAGKLIDPSYEPPGLENVLPPSDTAEISSVQRRMILDAAKLHEEIAKIGHTHGMASSEMLGYLMVASNILLEHARFSEAEPLMRRALAIGEQIFGTDHPKVATGLNNLARLLQATNRFAEAEPLMRRVLAVTEQCFGTDHPDVATALNNLALLLQATNRMAEAEPLMRRALSIDEQNFGPDHPDVAIDLNNLAALLQNTNRNTEAEPLMRRALFIDEQSFGTDHPNVAIRLNNLAQLLQDTSRMAEAEPLMRRALAIDERSFGTDHPKVAIRLNNFAQLLQDTNRKAEAEPLMRRALGIDERSFGMDHPRVAMGLNNLAQLLQDTNRMAEAEPLMRRALAIDEQSFGIEHPNVAIRLNNLAQLLQSTNRTDEAEPLMRRHLVIFLKFTKAAGHKHPHLETAFRNYRSLLSAMGRSDADIDVELEKLRDKSAG